MGWYNKKDAEKPVLPKGEYEAVLEEVTQQKSKEKGHDMRKCQFRVYSDGPDVLLFDYLGSYAAWKIKDLALAIGGKAESDFEAETFEPGNFCGSNIMIKLDIEENAQYGKQNKITGYDPSKLARKTAPAAKAATRPAPAQEGDDIVVPF